jgi:hypothetical protein
MASPQELVISLWYAFRFQSARIIRETSTARAGALGEVLSAQFEQSSYMAFGASNVKPVRRHGSVSWGARQPRSPTKPPYRKVVGPFSLANAVGSAPRQKRGEAPPSIRTPAGAMLARTGVLYRLARSDPDHYPVEIPGGPNAKRTRLWGAGVDAREAEWNDEDPSSGYVKANWPAVANDLEMTVAATAARPRLGVGLGIEHPPALSAC